MLVTELMRTTIACPTQWEGRLEDGRSLYVRYRHRTLRVGVGDQAKDAVRNSGPESALLCVETPGEGDDDMMSFEGLRRALRGVLEFPEGLVVEQHPDWGKAGAAEDG
jgi:hypothetical protein